jgi:hypothetical protein
MQIKRKREIEGRPIQTINRIPAFIDQVVGDARQNKPSIKVHAAEDGDIDIALIYDGLLRAIQNQSNADFAYDSAIENTATFGFGAWRIKTDYENEPYKITDTKIVFAKVREMIQNGKEDRKVS